MRLSLCILLLLCSSLFAQERQIFEGTVYDPFFSITLTDSDDQTYHLHGASFYNLDEEKKYFLWIRRGTSAGIVTYTLELDRIRSIEFTGPYGNPEEYYTPAILTLTDGSSYDVFVDTAGYFGGFDQDFGSYGRIYLIYNQVKSIQLNHQGQYQRCPYCGTIFFADDREVCPFDGQELILGLEP